MRSLDLTQLHEIRRQKIISQFTNQPNQPNQPEFSTPQIDNQDASNGQTKDNDLKEGVTPNNSSSEIYKVQKETEAEELKSKLNKVKNKNSYVELQIANEKEKQLKLTTELLKQMLKQLQQSQRLSKIVMTIVGIVE